MKILNITIIGLLLMLVCINSNAQQTVLDGVYIKEHYLTRKVIPYTPLREADVMWNKRIWRKIDLREKINHTMYFPTSPIDDRKSLFDVIVNAVKNDGTITAYDPGVTMDDEFKDPMTITEVMNLISEIDTEYEEDPMTGDLIETLVENNIETQDVIQYEIKEEWFFDRQKSVMEVRIIGIAPIIEERDEDGEFKGFRKLFWIYFPEARYVFANAEVFNRYNDAERRTYEDIFMKRMFGSFIIKEVNVYDRKIMEYKMGLDALLEAEKIKEDIFNMEHDLWHF